MFYINDVDVNDNVLSINKIVDKTPNVDSFMRENGSIAYPTKYQIEKMSITIGFDVSRDDHLEDLSNLMVSLDEYPFAFIRSEKIKSSMFNFTNRDKSIEDTHVQVFMIEKYSMSMSVESSNFIVANLTIVPFNAYSIVDDFSFLSYRENDNGSFDIIYGVDGPKESRIYEDFFKKKRATTLTKLKETLSNSPFSSIGIYSPFFTKEKPTDNTLTYETINYTDPNNGEPLQVDASGRVVDNAEDYISFFSYGKENPNDKYKREMYVYWRGDVLESSPFAENGIQSIEVSRENMLSIQYISGTQYPIIQYMGKGAGMLNISIVSKTGENTKSGTIVTPYALFNAMLEKYNYNLLSESRFSAFNIFKVRSAITDMLNIDGYVPAQMFLQNNSNTKLDEYTVVFVESNTVRLKDINKGKIEQQKDSVVKKTDLVDIIRAVNEALISRGYISKEIELKTWKDYSFYQDRDKYILDMIDDNSIPDGKLQTTKSFIVMFYTNLFSLVRTISSKKLTISSYINNLSQFMSNMESKNIKESQSLEGEIFGDIKISEYLTYYFFINGLRVASAKIARGASDIGIVIPNTVTKIDTLTNESILGEFSKFKFEALSDLDLGERLGITDGNSYLGIFDPKKITSAPFLSWKPLISIDDIKNEYNGFSKDIDEYFKDIYGTEKRLEDVAADVSAQQLDIKRQNHDYALRGVLKDPKPVKDFLKSIFGMNNDSTVDNVSSNISSTKEPVVATKENLKKNTTEGLTSSSTPTENTVKTQDVQAGSTVSNSSGKSYDLKGKSSFIEFVGARDAGYTDSRALSIITSIHLRHGRDLTKMTMKEVIDFQVWVKANYKKNRDLDSAAAGKYQVVRSTAIAAIENNACTWSDYFNEDTQDKIGFYCGTTKRGTKATNKFLTARNNWKNGTLSYQQYAVIRDSFLHSLSFEWACLASPFVRKKGAYVSVAEGRYALDNLPLFSNRMAQLDPARAATLVLPVDVSHVGIPTVTVPIDTNDSQFVQDIGSKNEMNIFQKAVELIIPDSDIKNALNEIDKDKNYTVFSHDVNMNIQAKDGTEFFRKGFDLAFPVVKVYIVFGGSNDEMNRYSIYSPNYIELNGLLECNVVLNDSDNPVDVVYLKLSNAGRVYTDQVAFWEAYKPKIDFEKYGTAEELRYLISMMMINPGNRLHIKAGYSNDPSKLETVFNGEITIVEEDDVLTVVAEGYGRELIMKKNGSDKVIVLSSDINSGTRESIAHMLIEFEEIQNFGRRSRSSVDNIISRYFKIVHGWGDGYRDSFLSVDEPEARKVATDAGGSDDSISWLRLGSNFFDTDVFKRQPMLKNIYADEITSMDQEFQINFANLIDINRNSLSEMPLFGNTTWEILKSLEYRHPNVYVKPMFYEAEMTLFYGIKDQCYLSSSINSEIQMDARVGDNAELYEKEKHRRYKAVSQTHIVSTGVNLISNRMKLNSDFPTRVNVGISDWEYSHLVDWTVDYDEYWADKTMYQMQFDDNLKPNAIRDSELYMNGCDSYLAAIRYGTAFLMDSVRCMYDGEISIIGNEKIKNGDVVLLNDQERGIYGYVEVSGCKHFYGSSTGFTTVFRPKMMTESKSIIWTTSGKKIRLAFARAFVNIIEKISENMDKSFLFSYLNATYDTVGNGYSKTISALGSPIVNNIEMIFRDKSGESASAAGIVSMLDIAFAGLNTYGVYKSISSVEKSLSKWKNVRMRYTFGRSGVANINQFTTALGRFGSGAVGSTINWIKARGTFGAMTGAGLEAAIGATTIFTSEALAFSLTGVFLFLTAEMTAATERFLLSRDPIMITPLMIFGRPFVSGINGAKSDGLVSDTLDNMILTFKNMRKIYKYNVDRVTHSNKLYSPFDKDYVEY